MYGRQKVTFATPRTGEPMSIANIQENWQLRKDIHLYTTLPSIIGLTGFGMTDSATSCIRLESLAKYGEFCVYHTTQWNRVLVMLDLRSISFKQGVGQGRVISSCLFTSISMTYCNTWTIEFMDNVDKHNFTDPHGIAETDCILLPHIYIHGR